MGLKCIGVRCMVGTPLEIIEEFYCFLAANYRRSYLQTMQSVDF